MRSSFERFFPTLAQRRLRRWRKLRVLRGMLLATPWLFVSVVAVAQALETPTAQPTLNPQVHEWPRATFPLSIASDHRYFVDASSRPFLVQGDAAWSLIAELRRDEVEAYLDDRKARGFNTLLISLIEHRFATNAPANAYGETPFLTPGNFAAPNERYFEYADWVLKRAADKGFLVLLAPAYIGARGGDEGWYQEMAAAGQDKLHRYGKFVGQRYKSFANILWVQGGDYNPPRKELVRAVAEGIVEGGSSSLNTAHCAAETAAYDEWSGEPWLKFNTIYTYGPVYAAAYKQYRLNAHMPFILIESIYENEHDASETLLRTQAFQALLSGAAGQIFGNNPMWHFSGPGLMETPGNWRFNLASHGAESMTHLRELLETVPWWKLEPDIDNRLLRSGYGTGQERAVAARSSDGSLAIIYLPTVRDLTIDFAELSGQAVRARWYDPGNGQYLDVDSYPFDKALHKLRPLKKNSTGSEDWVLILQAQ